MQHNQGKFSLGANQRSQNDNDQMYYNRVACSVSPYLIKQPLHNFISPNLKQRPDFVLTSSYNSPLFYYLLRLSGNV